ncbi:hypothetical protein F4861DRAFT_508527 [Xylaria intraflava]|nr:hypothetical protein F4861DRAFT_508527 [Xylaria intraflava]
MKYRISDLVTAVVLGFPSWATSQETGWQPGQVSTTMCAWQSLRAAQINDTVYLDGGTLYWVAGMADGQLSSPIVDSNPLGIIRSLNFSRSFDSSTNTTALLSPINQPINGQAPSNLEPNFIDGAMLANNKEFFLYGGLPPRTGSANAPPYEHNVLAYQAYSYGIDGQNFIRPRFYYDQLPPNITQYVTYGGAANAPSENKAWYFGGSRSPTWGPIFAFANNDSISPVNVSNFLITLDIGETKKIWDKKNLPDHIPSRANPSVVWVPVGEQGILVALGGVAFPAYDNSEQESQNLAQSMKDSPSYMLNIDIYDVANDTWYQQPTVGAPGQLAMGCAVVAPAQDLSSYNIYYYGGFDGIHEAGDFNDAVWVLSLPSFTWVNIAPGTPEHARAGHQCIMPYPDQMVVIGGYPASNGGPFRCLQGGVLQVFNLTEGKWLESYDPNNWSTYGVPEMVHQKIGGDYGGGATVTTPTQSGWATPGLAGVFDTKYPTSKITPNYPYKPEAPANGTRGQPDDGKSHTGNSRPWLGPVLGVVLGLAFVTAIVVAIILYRRRKLWWKKKAGESGNQTEGSENQHIQSWLNNTHEKEPTVTTDNPSSYLDELESRNQTPMLAGHYTDQTPTPEMGRHEMPADQRYELMDTSNPAELSGDGQSHRDATAKHTTKSPSPVTDTPMRHHQSEFSSSQATSTTGSSAASHERSGAQSVGNSSSARTAPSNRHAVSSDVSRISEREVSHLRNLSEQTVSSTTNTVPSRLSPTPPPMDEFGSGAAHNRAGGRSSSLRISMFREHAGDLDDPPAQSHTQ